MKTKAFIAEFIGTFALIFVGVGSIATNYMNRGGISGKAVDLTAIALAHGFTIAVMVSATAAISGGHLNPAVTFGAWIGKKIDLKNALGYIVFQCLGAIFAASLLKLVIAGNVLDAISMGTPSLGENETIVMAFVREFIFSFFLVFVVFGTAMDYRAPQVGGLFIGLTISLAILAGGALGASAMNPARYFGPALVGAGGAAATIVYHFVLEESKPPQSPRRNSIQTEKTNV